MCGGRKHYLLGCIMVTNFKVLFRQFLSLQSHQHVANVHALSITLAYGKTLDIELSFHLTRLDRPIENFIYENFPRQLYSFIML